MVAVWEIDLKQRLTADKMLGFTSPKLPLATSFTPRTLNNSPDCVVSNSPNGSILLSLRQSLLHSSRTPVSEEGANSGATAITCFPFTSRVSSDTEGLVSSLLSISSRRSISVLSSCSLHTLAQIFWCSVFLHSIPQNAIGQHIEQSRPKE